MVFGKLTFTPHGHAAPLSVPGDAEPESPDGSPFDAQQLVGQWIAEKSRLSRFAEAGNDDLLPVNVPHVRRRRR